MESGCDEVLRHFSFATLLFSVLAQLLKSLQLANAKWLYIYVLQSSWNQQFIVLFHCCSWWGL